MAVKEWKYKAKDFKGKVREGTLGAATRTEAQKQLAQMKLRPIILKEHRETFFSRLVTKDKKGNLTIQIGSGLPGLKDLAVFTKQFSLMIERGVPLIEALNILSRQQKNAKFCDILERIRIMVENGATLSMALSAFPKVFDDLYIALVRSGEISGNLDVVLQEIVKFLDKSNKLRKQLKSASVYPAMILFVATGITYGIMVFLVPVFAEQYKGSGQQLPAITQLVMNISDFLRFGMGYIVGGLFGTVVAFKKYRATPKGKRKVDEIMLKLPMIGDVIKKVAIGRFTATMSTMMGSGVSILDALTICSQSAGNKQIEEFLINVKEKISQGANFADPLGEGDLFPPMVVSMVTVGEQTGALDKTLSKVSEIYEEEVDSAVKALTEMMQPVLIVGIGGVLAFVIIALYLPMFDQANLVG